jgi:ABC transporter with metal-binding/Fe-S-binding domain ATP-binding protein
MPWVSLFSGGKDSSWALYRALQNREVARLVTVHPEGDSYMYHVPATRLAGLAAESIGIPLVDVEPGDLGAEDAADAGAQGDREVEPLEAALRSLPIEVEGVVAGAVESAYQTDRIRGMCDRLGAELYAPLYGENPYDLGRSMLDAGFEIRVVQVAARGLDRSWIGRSLDRGALDELRDLNEAYGVHVLGEGGEFETVVTDAPHMDRRIEVSGEPVWEGTRGHLRVEEARLGDRSLSGRS